MTARVTSYTLYLGTVQITFVSHVKESLARRRDDFVLRTRNDANTTTNNNNDDNNDDDDHDDDDATTLQCFNASTRRHTRA